MKDETINWLWATLAIFTVTVCIFVDVCGIYVLVHFIRKAW